MQELARDFLTIVAIVLLLVENWIFLRFAFSNRIYLSIFFKLLTFLLVLISISWSWLMVSFIFFNLVVSFLTAFIFQPEYRFFFIKYGNIEVNESNIVKKLLGINESLKLSTKFLDELIESVYDLANKGIGALIVIERKISLDYYIGNGYGIDTEVSGAILETIFNKHSPLHDGAVIIRDGKIVAAKCFLPMNTSEYLDPQDKILNSLGARHRAALGITQTTDAVSIVISETNSTVSFCVDGKIKYNISSEELYQSLINEVFLNLVPFEKIEKK